jgi:hypothetical protein
MQEKIKAAVAQFIPVHMDKKATPQNLILEAGRNGAQIFVTGGTATAFRNTRFPRRTSS